MSCTIRTCTTTATIHVYNLFGEAADLPDVVHCETIASRSVLHDWKLAPHRHARLHQVLLIESGGGQATLDGQDHALRPMHVVNVPVNHVHGFNFLPGTQGYVLTIAVEVLDEALLSSEGLRSVLVAAGHRPRHAAHARHHEADLRGARRATISPGRISCAPSRRR